MEESPGFHRRFVDKLASVSVGNAQVSDDGRGGDSRNVWRTTRVQLSWTCVFPASKISGFQGSGRVEYSVREVLDSPVPPIAQLGIERSDNCVVDTREGPPLGRNASLDGKAASSRAQCQVLAANDVNLAEPSDLTEMAAALALTPAENVFLAFPDVLAEKDTPRVVINGGLLLNVLLRGRWFCYLAGHQSSYQIPSVSGKKCKVLCKWASDGVIAAVCSAVAELPPDTVMEVLELPTVCRGRWLWVIYMLCCGSSLSNVDNLTLGDTSLTKADIAAISVMMQNRYPVVEPETSMAGAPEYGFASIPEGAELHSTSMAEGDTKVIISALPIRCRARYFPMSTPDWVEAVVPGDGICKTRVGHGASCFDRDSLEFDTQTFRDCPLQWLELCISEIGLHTLVLELLRYVGGGLRTLLIKLDQTDVDEDYGPNIPADLDLGELACACPHLDFLELKYFDVVVRPCHDEALRNWPITEMNIFASYKLPDLAPYLKRPEVRMARGLVDISIEAGGHEDFGEEKRRDLEGHDGEYLPLVKEKFPLQSKVGMLSVVVTSRRSVLAINKLNAHVLSRIFAFAATPERRTVRCRGMMN
jgi:hypothetical protein